MPLTHEAHALTELEKIMSKDKKKKGPISWKQKYQARNLEIINAAKERDRAVASEKEMGAKLAEIQTLFDEVSSNFGEDPLTIWNTYSRKVAELDALTEKAKTDAATIVHDAGNEAQKILSSAEKKAFELKRDARASADLMVETAQGIRDDVEKEVERRLNERKGNLDSLEKELDMLQEALKHRDADATNRELELNAQEQEIDGLLLENRRVELYIKNTMGDAPIKKDAKATSRVQHSEQRVCEGKQEAAQRTEATQHACSNVPESKQPQRRQHQSPSNVHRISS